MKRLVSVVALLLVAVMLFSACNSKPNNESKSENTTPQVTAPEVTTPEDTTLEETTPEATTPEATTPEATTPEGTTSEGTTPESTTSEQTTPEATTPTMTTPVETTPEVTTPEATTPEETTLPEPVELNPACEHKFTSRIVLEQVTTKEDGKIANVCGKCGGWQEEFLGAVKSLKILAIGNSFSNNALEYLPILAKELGIEEIIIGKLYVGGCTVDGHWSRAQSGADYESFQVNKTGDANWITYATGQRSLKFALAYEDWDIITMQQGSPLSGMTSSLGNLQNLIDYVNANKTNPNAKLYWHMTWAYSQFSTHSGFANYNEDQVTMYNAIVDLSKNYIDDNDSFTGIIPAGTAVQNYRDKDINNSNIESKYITTDGYHLQTYARMIATLTWLRTLTGLSLDDITCTSHTNVKFVKDYQLAYLKEAAEAAYLNPYEVTYIYTG